MRRVKKGSLHIFQFSASAQYEEVQRRFDALSATHDPSLIQELLQKHPFHVDSLLQMATIMELQGQHDGAAKMLRQALYVFESALHPAFKEALETGRARISTETESENEGGAGRGGVKLADRCQLGKSLFKTLQRRAHMLARRGCPRAAWAVALSLYAISDPLIDPMGVLLILDFYALKSGLERAWLWLMDLASATPDILTISGGLSLRFLPNLCFGSALARRLLGMAEARRQKATVEKDSAATTEAQCGGDGQQQSSVSLLASSDEMLISACTRYPFFVKRLLEATRAFDHGTSARGEGDSTKRTDNRSSTQEGGPCPSDVELLRRPLFVESPVAKAVLGSDTDSAETLKRLSQLYVFAAVTEFHPLLTPSTLFLLHPLLAPPSSYSTFSLLHRFLTPLSFYSLHSLLTPFTLFLLPPLSSYSSLHVLL